jgi:hypothetical protein
MPVKQRPCPGTRNGALRDPSDTVKARLPESQSPEDATFRPSEMYLKPAPCHVFESTPIGRNLRGAERLPMRGFKGMSGAPKSLYDVSVAVKSNETVDLTELAVAGWVG